MRFIKRRAQDDKLVIWIEISCSRRHFITWIFSVNTSRRNLLFPKQLAWELSHEAWSCSGSRALTLQPHKSVSRLTWTSPNGSTWTKRHCSLWALSSASIVPRYLNSSNIPLRHHLNAASLPWRCYSNSGCGAVAERQLHPCHWLMHAGATRLHPGVFRRQENKSEIYPNKMIV